MNMIAMAVAAAATVLLMPATDFVSKQDAVPAHVQRSTTRTDIIVGDGDFNQVQPEYPSDHATEHRNHTLRLQYIESMLRSRDVSDMPAELRAERMRNLDRLHNYWQRGEFPVNYDHPNAWEPCFIDNAGAICAVGYLVEQSAGREVAEKIDSRYRYATIKEIDAPELAQWIAQSGLTKAEVVTIQGPAIGEDEQIAIALGDKGVRANLKAAPRNRRGLAIRNTLPAVNDAPVPDNKAKVEEETPVQAITTLEQPVQIAVQPADSAAPSMR